LATGQLVDQALACVDCGEGFAFTVNEQRFYAERAIRVPTRCPECRAARRAERNAEAIKAVESAGSTTLAESLGNFGGYAAGNGRRNGRPAGAMFTATCAACGRDAELPFAPRGNRPVYCRACFAARRSR
jgi:CxxC-x17-CxxC domain-containing protein